MRCDSSIALLGDNLARYKYETPGEEQTQMILETTDLWSQFSKEEACILANVTGIISGVEQINQTLTKKILFPFPAASLCEAAFSALTQIRIKNVSNTIDLSYQKNG